MHAENDPEEQQKHLDNYYAKEKIQLDPTKVEKNPGLRILAKMMLNSMWGKFGQKPIKTQVKEFADPIQFHEFHDSDKYDVRYVSVLTEQRLTQPEHFHCLLHYLLGPPQALRTAPRTQRTGPLL